MRSLPLVYISALLLGGCSVNNLPFIYQPDLQQGTLIEESAVAQLRPGMSREQVRFLLGSPSIDDPFEERRWDYVYYYVPRGDDFFEAGERRLTLHFGDGGLEAAEGDFVDPSHPLYQEG
ncbi:outer membrane protein assembly factor BamE [Arhodomonas sp. SL1]|uniref:outer membrane protein assembly factor BamE n=1 Tax=Arhodomonas sp. SL1 TaxID=3425691 RepID=UPI003F882828